MTERPDLVFDGVATLLSATGNGVEMEGHDDIGRRGHLTVGSPDRRFPGRHFAEFRYAPDREYSLSGGDVEFVDGLIVFRDAFGGVRTFRIEPSPGDGGRVPLYVTGDLHGSLERLRDPFLDEALAGGYLIVAGDFGVIWAGHEDDSEETALLDWLDERPYTTLFIDGNHENHDRLDAMPFGKWKGGRVHFVSGNVIHLMRGEMYDIDGTTLFAMGGAHSHDKEWRVEGATWWRREVPSLCERERAVQTLEKHGWQADIVVSHAAPTEAVRRLAGACFHPCMTDEYADWLDGVAAKLDFKRWFFGHHHMDADIGCFRAICQDVVSILEA